MSYAELFGRVTEITGRKDNKISFNVYATKRNATYKVECSFFCPLSEGDAIYCYVLLGKTMDDIMTVVTPPFVQIGMDKNSIIGCFIKALRGTGFGAIYADKLYTALADAAYKAYKINNKEEKKTDEDLVVSYLSELSAEYNKYKDDSVIADCPKIIKEEQSKRLLNWWYKHRVLRRLYLFGLTDKEIRESGMTAEEIYQACLSNPYKVPSIPTEKCDTILKRQKKEASEIDKYCGLVIRKLWENLTKNGWISTPIKMLNNTFPNIKSSEWKERLEKEFGICFDEKYNSVYMSRPLKTENGIASYLHRLFKSDFNPGIKEAHYDMENLSGDQKDAIKMALISPISIITGKAGTGKTTIIKEIVKNLELNEVPYMITSFTGKAVARIREVIGRRTPATMHKLIANSSLVPPFSHLIVDESSMITCDLFWRFVSTFTGPYSITFIGDSNQLQPIEWGSLFSQIIESGVFPITTLTEIHRQSGGEDCGIMLNANNIIKGYTDSGDKGNTDGFIPDPDDFMFDDDTVTKVDFEFVEKPNFALWSINKEQIYDRIKQFAQVGVTSSEITVVSPYRADLDDINRMFQEVFNSDKPYCVDCKGKVWHVGDRVMMLENNYDINIMNGEEGVITDVLDEGIKVKFTDSAEYVFLKMWKEERDYKAWGEEAAKENKDLLTKHIGHSFALTVHKSQGSEWDYVIVYIPFDKKESSFLCKNLVYTSITRGRKAVWCVGDLKTFKSAALKTPRGRNDHLSDRLKLLFSQN